MKRVELQFPGSEAPLSVDLDWNPANGTFRLQSEVGELAGEARISADEPGTLRIGDRTVPFFAVSQDQRLLIWLGGQVYEFDLAPRAAGAAVPETGLPPGGEITAPMPGQVLRMLAEVGEQVPAGAPLVLMESMKMQLTITAPAAGTVVETAGVPGTMVELGAVLMRLEEA